MTLSSRSVAIPEDPTVREVVEMLRQTYTAEGAFLALTSVVRDLEGRVPIDLLNTPAGRREVYGWAMALAEGVFS